MEKKQLRAIKNRVASGDRRKHQDSDYKGPERRSGGERRIPAVLRTDPR
ncbi:MAG: hypothetical protein V3V95_05580 [Thermodesulfobacteriota bacterium]